LKIKSVKPCGEGQTYDLEVDHPLHQFYCNGLLTSNSHSVAYTYISYYESWLKLYYPLEFFTALLNNTSAKKEKNKENVISKYILDAQKGSQYREPITIQPPNINQSMKIFTIHNNEIYFGLAWVKNLGSDIIDYIIQDRDTNGLFKSVDDLYTRSLGYTKKPSKRDWDALVWSGSLDIFLIPNETRMHVYNHVYQDLRKEKKFVPEQTSDLDEVENRLIENENEYVNISFKEALMYAKLKQRETERHSEPFIPINILASEIMDNGLFLAKVVSVLEKITKTNKPYTQIRLRDETGEMLVFCWPWKLKGFNLVELIKGVIIVGTVNHSASGFIDLQEFAIIKDISKFQQDQIAKKQETEAKENEIRIEQEQQKAQEIKMEKASTKDKAIIAINKLVDQIAEDVVLKEYTAEENEKRFEKGSGIFNRLLTHNGKNVLFIYYNGDGFFARDRRIIKNINPEYLYIIDNNLKIHALFNGDILNELVKNQRTGDDIRTYPNIVELDTIEPEDAVHIITYYLHGVIK
jgi:DNA polymerase III alpha subunit